MPGFDTSTAICINNNGTYTIYNIGDWVDSFFNASGVTPVDEGNGVHSIDVSDQSDSILSIDNRGTVSYSPVTKVVRYTVSEMSPAPNVVTVSTLWGKKFTCADDSLLVTRINNNVASKPISQFTVGNDYLTTGMISHIPTGANPVIVKQVQYQVDYGTVVAHVITNTWGDNNFNRYDCQNCIQALQDDPSLDQSDIDVLNNVLGENTEYDQVIAMDSSTSTPTYLYDLRTNSGDYQMLNQFNTGTPPTF